MCTLYILLEHSLVVNTDIIHKYKNKKFYKFLKSENGVYWL